MLVPNIVILRVLKYSVLFTLMMQDYKHSLRMICNTLLTPICFFFSFIFTMFHINHAFYCHISLSPLSLFVSVVKHKTTTAAFGFCLMISFAFIYTFSLSTISGPLSSQLLPICCCQLPQPTLSYTYCKILS